MSGYEQQVAKRLTEVYHKHSVPAVRELGQMRIAIVSDLHKGRRDGADDFAQCEPSYLAAVQHYWQQGWELWLLGDVEELWENFPKPVIAAYGNVLSAEQPFAEAGAAPRYLRLVGNHDDEWYDPNAVQHHLGRFLGGQPVLEGVRVAIREEGQALGELFLVHGHQGTLDSDRFAGLSAWFVRTVWRPIQRLLRIKSNTPSNDFTLKEKHELALYGWAEQQTGLVLIAGHTHHPVWEGLSYQQALEQRSFRGRAPQVEQRWVQQEIGGRIELPGEQPVYFNTGCCAYSDGSCTALELEAGEIRLVRWEEPAQPIRNVLFDASLADVLRAVAAP